MSDARPGLNATRLTRLVREAVERCQLDLRGLTVYTEAATGAYAVTPVVAALAGATRVFALTRSTSHGTVEDVRRETMAMAEWLGVSERIVLVTEKREAEVTQADIVTNSGHVRPIDRQTVGWMKSGSVVSVMYESWELRPGEIDHDECKRRGVRVAGTNERHPNVDVFSYLGPMAVKLLHDAGVSVYRSRVLVVCDNPFAPFIRKGLEVVGAEVTVATAVTEEVVAANVDAILIATAPRASDTVGPSEARVIATRAPGAVVTQYWGEIDRPALDAVGVRSWPLAGPKPGHMGVLPSAVGPEPIVRLQAGGLKVAEVVLRAAPGSSDWEYVDAV